jgi:capsular exopolysaccharide synthesis family protein
MQPRIPARLAAGAGLTGKDVIRILRKRKLLIILSVVISASIAAIVTVLWGFYAPLYTTDALLAVNRPRSGGLAAETYLPGGEVMDRLLASSAQIAMSRPVMEAALGDPDLRQTRWFQKNTDNAVMRLQEEVLIAPVSRTNYIRASMTGRDKEELPVIVNAVAAAAVREKYRSTQERVLSDIRRVEAEQDELSKRLEEARKKVASKLEDRPEPMRIAELDRQVTARVGKLRVLEDQIARLELIRSEAISGWDVIKDMDAEQLKQLPEVQLRVESEPILQGLRSRKISIESERVAVARKLGPNHPAVVRMVSSIDSLDKQIEDRRKELTGIQVVLLQTDRQRAPGIIAQQLIQLSTERSRVDKEAEDAVKEVEALRTRYKGLEDELDRRQQQTDRDAINLVTRKTRLDNRLDELRLEQRGLEVLELERKAFPPNTPSWPKWKTMMPLGIIGGLVIGLGLAFLLELVDTSIRGPADVSRRVDLPLLGMVPHSDDLEDEIEDMRLAFMSAPNSIVAEAYRQIRTTLLFSGPASRRKSLLITSPLPGDGRTSVAMNLAGCIARGGHRVLVVDANFRQPSISALFPQAPQAGFSSALVGQADWRAQVHEVEENFYVLAAGPRPPNPAELFGSEQMRRLIQEMEAEYDEVIFDSAPCVVVTDSPVLSTEVNGVILVVRANVNTYGIVQRTRDILDRVGAHIVGVVLNAVRVTAGGYLRKNYETYYQYHQQPQLLAADAEAGEPEAAETT